MCGLAGVVGGTPTLEQLGRMAAAILHRGPDELGLYRDAHAGLVHTRLSIIDLATGQQPLANEDETLFVVFNGEIFNYVELRAELLALGHRFRTQSDTEVIVHAFESWGEEAFARFNGQFAIALWDSVRRRLILARDRFGVRPLHVCPHGGRLYFASEIKAIFAADAGIPRAFDPVGLDEVFTFWAAVAPRTPFAGVREVAPGHVLRWSEAGVEERAYWRPSFPADFSGTVEDAAEAVRAALGEATRLRMVRADVPVGSYLSGGLDSSIVAALGVGRRPDGFATFSLRFEDAEYDETAYQRLMAARLGSDHHELVVGRADIARAFPAVVAHAERPLLRTAPAPLYLLSELVRANGIKVVLTGEGADELFGGYDLFREAKVRRFWARQPGSRLRPLLLGRLYPYLARSPVAQRAMARQFFGRDLHRWREPGFGHRPRWSSAAALRRLFAPELRASLGDPAGALLARLAPELDGLAPLAQDQLIEISTLLSSYILSSQGDRMLMAHSVEGRFPFLDLHVAALAAALPAEHKLHVLDEKHVLKRAARDLVPASIVRRPKQPYRAPDAMCFVGPTAPGWVAEVLSPAAVTRAGVFDPAAVAQLWAKCKDRAGQFSNADNMALVGVLSTQLLHAELICASPGRAGVRAFDTVVDRLAS